MIDNNLNVKYLGQREISGDETANPMMQWMKHLQLASEFLTKSPNGNGSMTIDLDFELLCAKVLQRAPKSSGEFRGTVSGNTLTMEAGHIFIGGASGHSISKQTQSLQHATSGDCYSVTITGDNVSGYSYSLSWGSSPASCVTSSSLILPLCGAVKSGGRWVPFQYHLGSWVIPFPPACLISGYDTSSVQSLDHSGGSLVWTTYKRCGSNNQ